MPPQAADARVEAAIRDLYDETHGSEVNRMRKALVDIATFAARRAEDATSQGATEHARLWRGIADRATQELSMED